MFVKIESVDLGSSYIDRPESIVASDLFDGSEIGDKYLLTAIEMTEEEFAALPEFTGF